MLYFDALAVLIGRLRLTSRPALLARPTRGPAISRQWKRYRQTQRHRQTPKRASTIHFVNLTNALCLHSILLKRRPNAAPCSLASLPSHDGLFRIASTACCRWHGSFTHCIVGYSLAHAHTVRSCHVDVHKNGLCMFWYACSSSTLRVPNSTRDMALTASVTSSRLMSDATLFIIASS